MGANMQVLKVNAQRPALEFQQEDGTATRWEYDVIVLKLEMERLDEKYGLNSDKLEKPTAAYLADFAQFLLNLGCPACPLDLAMRMHQLVMVQFGQLSRSIVRQVHELQKEQSA
jgi:hypothetical protein